MALGDNVIVDRGFRELLELLKLYGYEPYMPGTFRGVSYNMKSLKPILIIVVQRPGHKVIKLEFILRLKIKRNDWLLVDTCPQAASHCA